MFGIDIDFSWMMGAFWQLPHGFRIAVGGGPELEAGGLALLKNSNNPAAPNLAAALAADIAARWQGRLGRLPLAASLRLRSPLLGAFYMNGYGETYYEIYLGNHSGLVHCGWPGNRQKFDLRAQLELPIGRHGLAAGYHFLYNRARANNLTYRFLSHTFTLSLLIN